MTAQQRPRGIDSMRERRDESNRRRNNMRQQRWEQQRLAVPYPTDGPKITLGLLWCAAVIGAGWLATPLLAVLVAMIAGLAGFQVGRSFRPFVDPPLAAGFAAVVALAGLFGALGLGIALIMASVGLHFRDAVTGLQASLVIAFLFLTAPVASHLISRAAYAIGGSLWDQTVIDEMATTDEDGEPSRR